jgi:hypothetical protein
MIHSIANNKHSEQEEQPPTTSTPLAPEASRVTGIVTNDYGSGDVPEDESGQEEEIPNIFSNSWKLNFVLASVSCWFAMSLTGWGSIQTGGNVADPLVGQVSMWMIVGSQWFVLTLYLWTLVAPRLFPDRDFSE